MNVICQCPACGAELKFDNTVERLIKCPKCAHRGQTTDFKEVEIKTVYCPNCAVSLAIRPEKVTNVITCPKCKRTEVSRKYTDTPPAGRFEEEEEAITETTTTGLGSGSRIYKPLKLVIIEDNGTWDSAKAVDIALKRGKNTLGRFSPSSSSSIQLPTTDPYMSKNHVTIEVIMRADSTFEHRLSDNRSTNGTHHNGQKIEPGDVIILTPGDTLRLGRTIFRIVSE